MRGRSRTVLDASAVIAALRGERGADVVADRMPGAAMSAVNVAEVVGVLTRRGTPVAAIHEALDPLELEIHPFDVDDAWVCGAMARGGRGAALSLGDRACLALAKRLGCPVVTADRSWRALRLGVEVIAIR